MFAFPDPVCTWVVYQGDQVIGQSAEQFVRGVDLMLGRDKLIAFKGKMVRCRPSCVCVDQSDVLWVRLVCGGAEESIRHFPKTPSLPEGGGCCVERLVSQSAGDRPKPQLRRRDQRLPGVWRPTVAVGVDEVKAGAAAEEQPVFHDVDCKLTLLDG